MNIGLQFMAIFWSILLTIWLVQWLWSRTRRNRYVRRRCARLGAPHPSCIVGEGWRVDAQSGHRY